MADLPYQNIHLAIQILHARLETVEKEVQELRESITAPAPKPQLKAKTG